MGAQNTKSMVQQLKIVENDWEYQNIDNGRQIVRHRKNNLAGEVQIIQSDPLHTTSDELQIYNYRKNQENAIVAVYSAQFLKSSQATMCGNQQNVKVITEYIPYRYYQLPTLTNQQALYALGESLRGFKQCYEKVGSFNVTDRMIGINNNGSIKVWLNQQFAQNHPSIEKPVLQITSSQYSDISAKKTEQNMVKNIISVIESKLMNKRFVPQLKNNLQNNSTFFDTYDKIGNYCQRMNLWIPDRIPLQLVKNKNQILKQDLSSQHPLSGSQPHATYIPNFQHTSSIKINQTKNNYVSYMPSNNYNSRPELINKQINTKTSHILSEAPKYSTSNKGYRFL